MNENKLMQQITAVFSVFMVLFYLGAGLFLLLYFKNSYVDRTLIVIMGSTFVLYGLYRAFRAYLKIVEVFFTNDRE